MSDVELDSEAVYRFQDDLTEAIRSTEEGVARFVEPAQGTLRISLSRRPHLVFGRRGSGKTSLLRKAIAEHNLDRRPSAFVDLEPFKGHTYPDVLISVLIEFFRSLKLWLDEAAVAPASKTSVWKRWLSKPRKRPLQKSSAETISAEIDLILLDLEELLYAQDDAEIERKHQAGSASSRGASGSIAAPIAGSPELSFQARSSNSSTEEVLDVFVDRRPTIFTARRSSTSDCCVASLSFPMLTDY